MKSQPVVLRGRVKLKRFAAANTARRDKERTKRRVEELRRRIGELQELLYANSKQAVLLLFQGVDASGKDGAIRSVLQEVNPAGVETANFKVPSDEESAHDFLWRVHHAVPRRGNIGVFNRSHYEAVLVERVLGDWPKRIVKQRYRQIVDFERMLGENGVVVLKFFLHLGREEQRKRFEERLVVPRKKWKFSEGDLEIRRRWKEYMSVYEDTLNATSHPAARWHLVPADHNWYRDFVVADAVVRAMEALGLKWPRPREGLARLKIK